MKFKYVSHIFSIIWYCFFFYFYWIDRSPEYAAVTILSFLLYLYLNKGSRSEFALAVVVAITHLAMWFFRFVPYLRWPFDFFVLSGIGFLFVKFLFKMKIQLNWKLQLGRPELLSIVVINLPAIFILLWYYSENKEVAQQWPLPS